MDNPEKLAHKQNKTTQKTKMMSNTDPAKIRRGTQASEKG
jgi:hypothetical protein